MISLRKLEGSRASFAAAGAAVLAPLGAGADISFSVWAAIDMTWGQFVLVPGVTRLRLEDVVLGTLYRLSPPASTFPACLPLAAM